MFTYNERDLHRMPTPARTHLPIKQFIADSNILDEESARDNEADIALLRLPAPSLRGTFAKAYALLTRLVAQIGWDELLRSRSAVFVMEEEYRMQKQKPEGGVDQPTNGTTDDHPSLPPSPANSPPLPGSNASMQALHSSSKNASTAEFPANGLDVPSTPIPTIKISSESDRDSVNADMERERAGLTMDGVAGVVDGATIAEEDNESVSDGGGFGEAENTPTLEKPELAQHVPEGAEGKDGKDANGFNNGAEVGGTDGGPEDEGFTFSTKRLCERWLDNLFMVLYEVSVLWIRSLTSWEHDLTSPDLFALAQDLRVYTIWRAEISHFKTQRSSFSLRSLPLLPACPSDFPSISTSSAFPDMSYRKTGTEWEILGDLALRLHHKEVAKDAYQRCLDAKFSAKAWQKLLETYADEGDLQKSLNAATRLTAYNYRWYTESSFPTAVGEFSSEGFRTRHALPKRFLTFHLSTLYFFFFFFFPSTSARDLQDRSDPRPLQDLVHAALDEPPRRSARDHAGVPQVRRRVQGRGERVVD